MYVREFFFVVDISTVVYLGGAKFIHLSAAYKLVYPASSSCLYVWLYFKLDGAW